MGGYAGAGDGVSAGLVRRRGAEEGGEWGGGVGCAADAAPGAVSGYGEELLRGGGVGEDDRGDGDEQDECFSLAPDGFAGVSGGGGVGAGAGEERGVWGGDGVHGGGCEEGGGGGAEEWCSGRAGDRHSRYGKMGSLCGPTSFFSLCRF